MKWIYFFILTAILTELPAQAVLSDHPDSGQIYTEVEVQPEYPGGIPALYEFLQNQLKYPESARARELQGKVMVEFVVNKAGQVNQINIVKGLDPELDAEALRIFGLLADWKPAELNGEKVKFRYTVPFNFILSGPKAPPLTDGNSIQGRQVCYEPDETPYFIGNASKLRKQINSILGFKVSFDKELGHSLMLSLLIDTSGTIHMISLPVYEPMLQAKMNEVAVLMKKGTWGPATKNGQAVDAWLNIELFYKKQ